MTYPYIGKREETGSTIIFLNDNRGIRISEPFDFICTRDKWKESAFKNITTEYLANTYGEVKSKEHAEFIVRLAEVNGFDIGIKSNTPSVFEFSGMLLNIYANDISSFAHNVESRQITIPLPPECDEKIYRHEGMAQKPKHFDCICTKCGGRCCIGNCDEWPKVGDDVEVCFESIVIGGKLLALTKEYAILSQGQGEQHFHLNSWSFVKPKTPEQELLDGLHAHFEKYTFADQAINELPLKYNITKKGEGDELQ